MGLVADKIYELAKKICSALDFIFNNLYYKKKASAELKLGQKIEWLVLCLSVFSSTKLHVQHFIPETVNLIKVSIYNYYTDV